jgi:hypothetical protein
MSEPKTIEEIKKDIQKSERRDRLILDYVTDVFTLVTENRSEQKGDGHFSVLSPLFLRRGLTSVFFCCRVTGHFQCDADRQWTLADTQCRT